MSLRITASKRSLGVISIVPPSDLLSEAQTPKQWNNCPDLTQRVRSMLQVAKENSIRIRSVELLNPGESHFLARMLYVADDHLLADYMKLEAAFGSRLEPFTDDFYVGVLVLQMEVPRARN